MAAELEEGEFDPCEFLRMLEDMCTETAASFIYWYGIYKACEQSGMYYQIAKMHQKYLGMATKYFLKLKSDLESIPTIGDAKLNDFIERICIDGHFKVNFNSRIYEYLGSIANVWDGRLGNVHLNMTPQYWIDVLSESVHKYCERYKVNFQEELYQKSLTLPNELQALEYMPNEFINALCEIFPPPNRD